MNIDKSSYALNDLESPLMNGTVPFKSLKCLFLKAGNMIQIFLLYEKGFEE